MMERGMILSGVVIESKDGSYTNRKSGQAVHNWDVSVKTHDYQGGTVRTFGSDEDYEEGEEVLILVDCFAKVNMGEDGKPYAKLNVKRVRRLDPVD